MELIGQRERDDHARYLIASSFEFETRAFRVSPEAAHDEWIKQSAKAVARGEGSMSELYERAKKGLV